MSNGVLYSVRPKWCEKIIRGEKTLEIRKSKPKLPPPFKSYIYCTKPSRSHQTICGCMVLNDDELYRHPKYGIRYGDSIELMAEDDYTSDNFLNGKVIGEFVCDAIYLFSTRVYLADAQLMPDGDVVSKSCLSRQELRNYEGHKTGLYAIHIPKFTLYDKPKTLSDFRMANMECLRHGPDGVPVCEKGIPCQMCQVKRPPQSWMYVEELP